MHGETLASNGETPFTSAPSSPGRSAAPSNSTSHMAYFFSAPASPTHFLLSSSPSISTYSSTTGTAIDLEQPDFEFGLAARLMSTAEELFFNGQIRPGFVSTDESSIPHSASIHRRTRSVSPTRSPRMLWREQRKELASLKPKSESEAESNSNTVPKITKSDKLESASASTSRSSSSNSSSCNSSNTNSRRWGFIKDLLLLQRSKSEGRMLVKNGAGVGARPVQKQRNNNNNNCVNGCDERGRLRYSASFSLGLCKERHDKAETTVRLVKEATRRTTFLPYKQQGFLFGCLGFSSRGFVRNVGIPTVSSRHPQRHRQS